MKKSILILFVLLSQVCLGQAYHGTLTPGTITLEGTSTIVDLSKNPYTITGPVTGFKPLGYYSVTLENIIMNPTYPNYEMRTREYYAHVDSIILELKAKIDSMQADYDKILYKLILNETEKYNGRK
jgi:hypothetical protein